MYYWNALLAWGKEHPYVLTSIGLAVGITAMIVLIVVAVAINMPTEMQRAMVQQVNRSSELEDLEVLKGDTVKNLGTKMQTVEGQRMLVDALEDLTGRIGYAERRLTRADQRLQGEVAKGVARDYAEKVEEDRELICQEVGYCPESRGVVEAAGP